MMSVVSFLGGIAAGATGATLLLTESARLGENLSRLFRRKPASCASVGLADDLVFGIGEVGEGFSFDGGKPVFVYGAPLQRDEGEVPVGLPQAGADKEIAESLGGGEQGKHGADPEQVEIAEQFIRRFSIPNRCNDISVLCLRASAAGEHPPFAALYHHDLARSAA